MESVELIEEELYRLNDEIIDQLKETWRDNEILIAFSQSIKNSSDKSGLIRNIKISIIRVLDYYV